MKYVLISFLLLFSIHAFSEIPYQDEKFGCLTAVVANKYINDFHINVKSFGGLELCNSEVDTKKLLNDIDIVANGQFAGNGQNNLIRNFVAPNNYYDWMKQQTRGVERGNDVPYATAYNSGGYFTMQDGWASSSTLGRVGTFIHEARHTQGYRHISCAQGPYFGSGLSGCDENYSYGGSHAVEMEYYANVSVNGLNFHPVYKKMARLMAMARSNFVFNTSPMKTREGVLALAMDRKSAMLYDNGNWVSREVPQASGRLKRTSFGGVLFDGSSAYSIDLYQNSGFVDLVSDTYSYFKLLLERKLQIKDFEEFDAGAKRYVVQMTNNKMAMFDFPSGSWGQAQSLPFDAVKFSTAIPGQTKSGLYIINTKNEIYIYQLQTQRLISQAGAWDTTNKEVITFAGQNLILKADGRTYVQSANNLQAWDTQNLFSEITTVPIYDAFEVVK
ncbi:MAG: hypothetical protein H7328_05860 [Bdellovibrio sp.]|nr:hypothetical protein [Bdellovibrio sp.]